ncbi:hypothetical protein ACSQ67_001162 [Phaseolus vulgaris]
MAHFCLLKLSLASSLYEQMRNIPTKKRVAKGQRIGGVSTQNGKCVGMENYNLPLISLTKGCRNFLNWMQWNGNAGQLNINGTYYKLIQCHWHTPSEHTLNGRKFDLELHAVHQNSKGETAVIGIWYKIGRPDRLLSKLLKDLKSLGDKDLDLGVINPGIIKFGSRKYYRYVGSLTTPPCTEGVVWTIVKKVRTVSREQLRALKAALHHEYEDNARPTQEVNGREVWLYRAKENAKTT